MSDTPTFASLGLPTALVNSLSRAGFESPFPIQEAAIPDILAGRDVLGRGKTGSGKTLAFGLPLLAQVGGKKAAPKRPLALILVLFTEAVSVLGRRRCTSGRRSAHLAL